MSEAAAKKKPGTMKTIGEVPCLSCGRVVPLKEQSSGLSAISCSWCGVQIYAKSEDSDARLRKRMITAAPEVKPPKEKMPLPTPTLPTPKKSFIEDL